jgi:hypothetical protein
MRRSKSRHAMNPAAGPASKSPFLSCWAALACLGWVACTPSANTLVLRAAAPVGLANAALFRQIIMAEPASLREAAARAGSDRALEPSALAVGASGDELIGARLDRSTAEARQWRVAVTVSAPPVLAPGLLVFGSGDELIALSPETGQRLWAMPARGAAALASSASAKHTALLLGDRRGRRWISVYDSAPRERLRITAEALLGAPTLLGNIVLVPVGDGYVSAIDVARFAEVARIRLGSAPVQPLSIAGTLFYGGPPWHEAARDAPGYALPRRPLPEPVQNGPVDVPVARPGARQPEATRLYVDPTPGPSGARDIYLATQGRIALGLERERGTLEWVIALPGRVLAATAAPGGFALCDASGGVRLIAGQTGHVERHWQLVRERRITLGEPTLVACTLSGGRILGADPDRKDTTREPLLDQLARVLELSDPALAPVQRFLARELAARDEPEATRVLIDLVSRRSLDRLLQSEAEDLLATRRVGNSYMLAALAGGEPRGEQALPPIAPLGEALAALGERRAAPLLARQLNRPAHATHALARAAAALETLASEGEYDELSVFFSLHRTSADDADSVAAVVSIARTLLRVGGQKARTLLQFATLDPLTVPEVKAAIDEALAANAAAVTGL